MKNEQQNSNQNSKICYVCEENFEDKHARVKKYCKVRDRCHYAGEYRRAAHSIWNLKYSVPKETLIVFHNGSNYDYHFIIKVLAEKFEKKFTYLRENTEKSMTCSVPIEKEVTRIDKKGKEITKTIFYR